MAAAQDRSLAEALGGFVLDVFPYPVVALDADGKVVQQNRAARDHLDLGSWFERAAPEPSIATLLETLRRHGRGSLEMQRQRTSGGPRTVLFEGWRIDSWFVLIARDTSEASELQEELRRRERADSLGLFTAGVVHDLNNLLTPILCLSAVLAAEVGANGRAASLVADIDGAALRAARLVRDVVVFARPRPAKAELLSVNQVAYAIKPLLERLLGQGMELKWALSEPAGPVLVDGAELERALLNLVANARDAMPRGGQIMISSADLDVHLDADGEARPYTGLFVIDDGLGMSEDVRERAFERFYTTKGEHGSGLGLASVQRFAHAAGGFVRLESEPGQGTIAGIYLPRISDVPVAAPALESNFRRAPGDTILVADGDTRLRQALSAVLEAQGYRVLEASSAAHVKELLDGRAPVVQLLLLDVALVGNDPSAFLNDLRRDPQSPRAILMINEREPQPTLPQGTFLLRKAFSERELLGAIGAVLRVKDVPDVKDVNGRAR